MLFVLPGIGITQFPPFEAKGGGAVILLEKSDISLQLSKFSLLAELVLSLHALIHDSSDSSLRTCKELQPSDGRFLLGARALLKGPTMIAVTFPYDVSLW